VELEIMSFMIFYFPARYVVGVTRYKSNNNFWMIINNVRFCLCISLLSLSESVSPL